MKGIYKWHYNRPLLHSIDNEIVSILNLNILFLNLILVLFHYQWNATRGSYKAIHIYLSYQKNIIVLHFDVHVIATSLIVYCPLISICRF